MKTIHYTELGASLFVPATHKDLLSIVSGEKYPKLRSVVLDTEDGIAEESLEDALGALELLLKKLQKRKLYIFLRPRNTKVLKRFLNLESIEKIDGFVLPKFSLENAQQYLSLLERENFVWMPSIEGEELFDEKRLIKLKELLLPHKESIILVRFGLEDMLRQLALRRKCDESIFDRAVTRFVLGRFIGIFKSAGFCVSGGVYPCYKDENGFVSDVERDLLEGLFTKTVIHPKQVGLYHELVKVTRNDFEEAVEILLDDKAVYAQNNKMAESSTMSPWAKEIVLRAQIYGLQ
ncbi:MAG: HpcH/HpaI aldolase/citrate lyase family protein [Helicobacteraceae bacterium]|nr:HpcH/HpaI aldolase/citrate lyase family protein [Helicobacteraceae bacterium]